MKRADKRLSRTPVKFNKQRIIRREDFIVQQVPPPS
jgi:hypothetical protein